MFDVFIFFFPFSPFSNVFTFSVCNTSAVFHFLMLYFPLNIHTFFFVPLLFEES